MRYRKKPVVIDAIQWWEHGDHPKVERLDQWNDIAPHINQPERGRLGWVSTLEGGHIVTPGDWIITGVKGEHYPCKNDVFVLTYEALE